MPLEAIQPHHVILAIIVVAIVALLCVALWAVVRKTADARAEAVRREVAERVAGAERQQRIAAETAAAGNARDASKHRETAAKRAETVSRKDGHIYVVSNPASFGSPSVLKIGMSRASDPVKRVAAGNTHVPYRFVLNLLAHVTDVAGVERRLHERLHQYRMNHAKRNEFFNAAFDTVTDALREISPGANFQVLDAKPAQGDYEAMVASSPSVIPAPSAEWTALVFQEHGFWVGTIAEVEGVMAREPSLDAVLSALRRSLRAVLEENRRRALADSSNHGSPMRHIRLGV